MKRAAAFTVAVLTSAAALGWVSPETQPNRTSTFRDGDLVEFTGFPVNLEFQDWGGVGVLRFGVSTRDLTLPCYDRRRSVHVLRDLHDRLNRVVGWNGERLLAGERPAPVNIRGLFDTYESAVIPFEIRIPRVDEIGTLESMVWDRFDPNRSDRLPTQSAFFRLLAEYLYPPSDFGPVVVEPVIVEVTVVVNVEVDVEVDCDDHDDYCWPPPPTLTPPPTPPPPTPTPPTTDESRIMKVPTWSGRAEKWGMASQIGARMNNPMLRQKRLK